MTFKHLFYNEMLLRKFQFWVIYFMVRHLVYKVIQKHIYLGVISIVLLALTSLIKTKQLVSFAEGLKICVPLILAMGRIDVFGSVSVVCHGIIIIFFKKLCFDFHYAVRLLFFLSPTSPPSALILRWKISLLFHPKGPSEINMATADCWQAPAFKWDVVVINRGPAPYLSVIPVKSQNVSVAPKIQLVLCVS